MNVIYLSALSSESLINKIYDKTGANPGFAVQKFSRLLVGGLIQNNQQVLALSNPPIPSKYSRKHIVNLGDEVENNIHYKYIPFINISFLKHICVFIYTFIYLFFWGLKNRKKKYIICDALSISSSFAAILASKVNRVKTCGVVTDIYGLMVGNKTTKRSLRLVADKLNRIYSRMFDSYVLLTEPMNDIVNPKHRPYIVMEAMCDFKGSAQEEIKPVKDYPKVLLYAGGLEQRYGLKMLVEAFNRCCSNDMELHIYGSGSYVSELKQWTDVDSRIKYWGVRPVADIVKAERRATLLINPRFTTEEFTKYSFPSKNMEYMASGTPVLTTRLPGMPAEYNNYVYFLEEESVDGYSRTISYVMSLDETVLFDKGDAAKKFVQEQKNNIYQTNRIIKLLESLQGDFHCIK